MAFVKQLFLLTSLRLYGSMNRQPDLEAPSKQRNTFIVDMKGRLEIRDLKSTRHVYLQ